MLYRKLGRTGLQVSEISLGSWLTYGNTTDDSTAIAIIDKAYELGINSFDTANMYNFGEAEKVVGKALAKYDRNSYVIATKACLPMGEGPNMKGLSRKHVFEQLHGSLKRLNMDYVDIFYCHRYDPETPVDETLRTIDDLVTQGKVLYVGVSMWTAAQIQEALHVADKYLLDRIVVNQPSYNMLNRSIEEEIIPVCQANGIGQIVFSPLAQGLLTGKYKSMDNLPEGSRATNDKIKRTLRRYLSQESIDTVSKLVPIADKLGITMSQLALAWILRLPNIASALIGATRPSQVEENVKASGIVLPDEIIQEIDEILNQ